MKDVTVSSGYTYTWNALSTPAHSSSSASHGTFLSVPRTQIVVLRWQWFIASHGMSISQVGQQGWGWLL